MIEDIAGIAAGTVVECDMCIVGSGPVGLAIAMEFDGTPVRVVILESGGDRYEPEIEALSAIESVGQRRVHHSAVRRRIFGGTSSVWSGRCVPFSAMDLQTRSWIPHSGWPLQSEELEQYLQRAGRFLEVAPAIYDDRIWSHLDLAPPRRAWDPSRFSTQIFQASVVRNARTREIPPPVDPDAAGLGALRHSGAPLAEDLAERTRAAIGASGNIRLLLHAHATQILTNDAGTRATGAIARSLQGAQLRIHGAKVVLAAGGLENARLLLLSNQVHADGLGNAHDQVGRYLQDHHYAPIATISGSQARKLRRRLGYRWFDHDGHRHVYMTAISLSSQQQRESGVTRATIFPFEHYLRPAAIGSAKRFAQSLHDRNEQLAMSDLGNALAHPFELARGAMDRYAFKQAALQPVRQLDIGCCAEQLPDPQSRVTLSDRRDAFGQPLAKLDWRIADLEFRTYQQAGRLFLDECRRLKLEEPVLSPWLDTAGGDWRAALHDMAHPMCTTRMAGDPRHGVVDGDCQVFGVTGLHVAGSSAFATGGTANPTLTAVALGLRLADNLRKDLRATHHVEITSQPRMRVAVLGAGSRIRDVHLPVLQALGDSVEVAGFTSRSEQGRATLAAQSGWKPFSSVEELLEKGSPDFALAAVSGDSNDAMAWQAIGRRLPLLGETPLAWNERAGRALVGAARATGTIFGIAEQFPTLPAMLLTRKLIGLGGIGSVIAAANDFATYDYHGIAQLRALAGYERRASRLESRRFRFGNTGLMDGSPPPLPELGWPEEWELATIEMSDGRLLTHNFSAGYAVLPTRPNGRLSVYGESGCVVDETLTFVDRHSGARHSAAFERRFSTGGTGPDLAELGVTHPALGRITWRNPFAGHGLSEEQVSVALHMRAFADAVRHRGAPLYTAAEALEDIEVLRGLYYSAQTNGSRVNVPLRPRWRQLHLLAHRVVRQVLRK